MERAERRKRIEISSSRDSRCNFYLQTISLKAGRKLSIRVDANALPSPPLCCRGKDATTQLKVRYSPGRFNENAHTRARTRSHANEGNMQSGFDRIANATRVHTHTHARTRRGRCLFEHPLLKSCQRPLNHSFRSLIVNVPR